ncbi:MAG: hypothetical protein JWL82_36 [Parcubacteria group bacterium]|nr:hypothetical protein [Parcubacteria group bacterium]
MTIILFVLGFVLGAGALVFALQNNEIVSLTFLGWQFDSSLALLVIVSVAVGILISMLAFLPSALAGSFRIMGLKKENKKLAETLEAHQQPQTVVITTDPLP